LAGPAREQVSARLGCAHMDGRADQRADACADGGLGGAGGGLETRGRRG
jgi:hypothetical protein